MFLRFRSSKGLGLRVLDYGFFLGFVRFVFGIFSFGVQKVFSVLFFSGFTAS